MSFAGIFCATRRAADYPCLKLNFYAQVFTPYYWLIDRNRSFRILGQRTKSFDRTRELKKGKMNFYLNGYFSLLGRTLCKMRSDQVIFLASPVRFFR